MALNFPTDTSVPYYDPISGLKYIYNSSIGAWESAIQPPAVIRETAPTIDIPGFLWWDSNASDLGGRLKIWYESNGSGAWVDATPVPDPPAVFVSPVAPTDESSSNSQGATPGDLWWDTHDGRLYIYYEQPVGQNQWVDASPSPDNGGQTINTNITSGTTPPQGPSPNDMWYNTAEGNLFIYYQDINSAQWVVTQSIDVVSDTVQTLETSGPITLGGTSKNITLGIGDASTTVSGITRLATTEESTTGTATDVALTPAILKSTISSYISGTVEYATSAEATSGTLTNKAITPAALAAALPSLGTANPVGTVLEFANQTAPSGYVKCDGAAVSRTTYSGLFSVIGTTFGVGDTSSTFNLPTLAHANALMIYCIKH